MNTQLKGLFLFCCLTLSLVAEVTPSNSSLEKEILVDKDPKYKFTLLPHHENFLLFAGHSSSNLIEKHWNQNGNRDYNKDYTRDTNEAQFQISFKLPLYNNMFNSDADLFIAYTQNSFWQLYNNEHSKPFRETNYMPELFIEWHPNIRLGKSELKEIRLSLAHQSNGKDVGASRSWNKTQIHFLFQNNNLLYGIDIWDRWNENQKDSISDPKGDDNPNLQKYIGKQKYFIAYKTDNYKLSLTHQNDIFDYDSSKGNTKLDFIFPSMHENFDFFIRYFHGYGESLIDYDVKVERISFGIILADWK